MFLTPKNQVNRLSLNIQYLVFNFYKTPQILTFTDYKLHFDGFLIGFKLKTGVCEGQFLFIG